MTHVFHAESKTLTVPVPGDILSTSAAAIREDLDRAIQSLDAECALTLEIDARKALMIDSVGLNLIVATLRQAKTRGITLRLRVSDRNVHRILLFTCLDKYLEVVRQ